VRATNGRVLEKSCDVLTSLLMADAYQREVNQAIIDNGGRKIISLLIHPDDDVVFYAMSVSRNFLAVNDVRQRQFVVHNGGLPNIMSLFSSQDTSVRVAAVCSIDNLLRGHCAAMLPALEDCGMTLPLIERLGDEDSDVRGIASSAVQKITHARKKNNTSVWAEHVKCIERLCALLLEIEGGDDVDIDVLRSVRNILVIEGVEAAKLISNSDTLQVIETLKKHSENDVSQLASKIETECLKNFLKTPDPVSENQKNAKKRTRSARDD